MKNNILLVICWCVGIGYTAFPGEPEHEENGWRWLEGGLTFRPAVASAFEPRIGFTSYGDRNNIRLDIGSGIDLLSRRYGEGKLAVGGEFFTFTLLESWDNMHFPVIATDYFFGMNLSYRKTTNNGILSGRFRITHISAHFVDGHYDADAGTWRDEREPIIYSREFIELLGSYRRNGALIHRWYGGFQYLYNVIPGLVGKLALQGGYELFFPSRSEFITPYGAYDLRVVNIESWNVNHSVQVGLKFGHRFGRGFDAFFSYYNGYNLHGELFDQTIETWGFGFNIHI
jgi:hypothetical protein